MTRRTPRATRTDTLLPYTTLVRSGGIGQPVILLNKDDAPGKSPAIEQGNGFGRILLRVDDATALSARLTAAGYTPDEMHADAVSKRKVFWATDPDGFRYEIKQAPPSQ